MNDRIVNIDLAAFRDWLRSHDPEAEVGQRGEANSCPVKNYLSTVDNEITGVGYSLCYKNKKEVDSEGFTIVPRVSDIISRIDNGRSFRDSDINNIVTAQTVLEILYKLRPELITE